MSGLLYLFPHSTYCKMLFALKRRREMWPHTVMWLERGESPDTFHLVMDSVIATWPGLSVVKMDAVNFWNFVTLEPNWIELPL